MKFKDQFVSTVLIFLSVITIGCAIWFGFCGGKTKITEENFNEYMSLSYEFKNNDKKSASVAINIKPKNVKPCEYNNLSIGVKIYARALGLSELSSTNFDYYKWIDVDNIGNGKLLCTHYEGYLDKYGTIDFLAQAASEYKWVGQKVELFAVRYEK